MLMVPDYKLSQRLLGAALVAALSGCGGAATKSKQNSAVLGASNAGGTSATLPEAGSAQAPSPPPAPVAPAAPQPTDAFSANINPVIVANCGTTSCHGVGATAQTVYQSSSANFLKEGLMIIPAITSTYANTVLAMPPLTSGKKISDADQKVLIDYLTANNITVAPANPIAPPATPSPTPQIIIPVTKLCDSVSAADKASGAALTFSQYTTATTTNCGGGGCHSGGSSTRYFVGNLTSSMDAGYSQEIIGTIRSGSMPRGRTMSSGDKATIIDYLCGHLDI